MFWSRDAQQQYNVCHACNFKFPSSHIRKVQSKNLMFCFIQYIQYYIKLIKSANIYY